MNITGGDIQRVEVEAGIRLAVNVSGASGKQTIVMSNSLATTLGIWDEVAERLSPHLRLVRYDTRGHGRSDAPNCSYSLSRLGNDIIAILDALKIERAVVCGISLGGLTAMWLGAYAAERVSGLVLANTAANFPPEAMWRERAAIARASGVSSFVQPSLERWLTSAFRAKHVRRVGELEAMINGTSASGYAGCCEVLATTNLLPVISNISRPVRVIAGRYDPSTAPSRAAEIASAIPNADLVTLEAAHISAVEAPAGFAAAINDFLPRIS